MVMIQISQRWIDCLYYYSGGSARSGPSCQFGGRGVMSARYPQYHKTTNDRFDSKHSQRITQPCQNRDSIGSVEKE